MRAVVQRVTAASVSVEGDVVGDLASPGLLVYLGVTHTDDISDATWMAAKLAGLRLMEDEVAADGFLVISQFTLYGDARRGRRPSWSAAAPGSVAEPLYTAVCDELAATGAHVSRGIFGADMQVASVNDGPITLILESPERGPQ